MSIRVQSEQCYPHVDLVFESSSFDTSFCAQNVINQFCMSKVSKGKGQKGQKLFRLSTLSNML